jgi:anti-sigma factor RsiW
MNCSDFHEMISAYADNELSEAETKKLLDHLNHCPDCNRELAYLTRQRERVAASLTSADEPVPHPAFARTVLAEIDRLKVPRRNPVSRFFQDILDDLLLPFRKPVFALPVVLILVTGTLAGFYLQSLPNNPQQQLLSVYDVAASQHNTARTISEAAPVGEDVELHIFDHFADTSTETFAANPCLLEYASYTCTSEVEDY